MDKVFQEEQIQLAEIESKIDAIASRYERNARDTQAEIADFYCVDNDDRQRLKELRQEKADALKFAEIFRSYQPSPYFGRLEVDRENGDEIETLTFLIGKEGISDSARSIVTDWRSPMGACYYATTQREFLVNGAKYQLALRRALDIRNATLVSYRTEYDGETVSLEGDVIDPFLLTVLKDKRRHNRLTDIIRTIQGNQNEIIRKPRTESFVVQGCAGSGKTMILLHRLSFLKFNNRNMSLNGVKIITPNKFFDAHINDLSVELGLTAIERFSVEEYYAALIKRYSSKVSVESETRSEKTLSADLLAEIYSLNYFETSTANYHAYWIQTLSGLNEAKLNNLFGTLKITYPDTTIHSSDTFASLELGIKRIAAAIADTEKKKKNVADRLASIDGDISALQAEHDLALSNLGNTRTQTVKRVEHEVASLTNAQDKLEAKLSELRAQRDAIQKQKTQAEADLNRYVSLANAFPRGAAIYSDYDQFVQTNDSGSTIIRRECGKSIDAIITVEAAYAKTPVYNFAKRNSLRKAISEARAQFTTDVTNLINLQTSEAQRMIGPLREAVDAISAQLTDISETIRTTEREGRSLKARIAAWKECSLLFASSELPDVRTGLLPASYKECSKVLSTYEEQRNAVNRFAGRIDALIKTKHSLVAEQLSLEQSGYSNEDKTYIEDCAKIVRKLHFSEVSRNVMFRDLLAKYRLHKQNYQKTNFRHKLYLKLLFCSLYFSRPANPDSFLNIDEAQDISVSEYRLLRTVLGEKCIFNLYGDINQSVYSYKGIFDWDEITDITGGNIYVLNENYRNTLEITEFCNNEFGAEVYAIGVSGEPVVELDTAAAVKWILNVKQAHPEYRVAILHRHGLKDVTEMLRTLLDGQDVSWYAVDEKKLSIVSVETAKGLEFEAVVAIVDQMSSNEKYISYTRALDQLTVVRDKFSTELDVEDSAEEIDDEFAEATPDPEPAEHDENSSTVSSSHAIGHFYSWEIIDEKTAIKTCDKSFFDHNGSGVPRDICWFFDSGSMQRGDSRTLTLIFEGKRYDGKVAYEASGHSRMRLTWGSVLGELLGQKRNADKVRAVFQKTDTDVYLISMIEADDAIPTITDEPALEVNNDLEPAIVIVPDEHLPAIVHEDIQPQTKEESALVAEFNSILEERFGAEFKLSVQQQSIALSLYRGRSVACNAPSGSMKSVILYLMALKEHQASGKQTLLSAEAHLQENELVLAEKLGLKCGCISSLEEFRADFKKDKYDVIFVSYEHLMQHENVAPLVDFFADKIAYWGFDHPSLAKPIWMNLSNCCKVLNATAYVMSKEGFAGLDLNEFDCFESCCDSMPSQVKKLTFSSASERLKWFTENMNAMFGQGLVYCDSEDTCKELAKLLRKNKIMAEAYIDVTNIEKKERINYLTNSFSTGSIPVFVTTHEAGKNLSNPRIRFVVHFDLPADQKLYELHISQIGQLAETAVVYDLIIM